MGRQPIQDMALENDCPVVLQLWLMSAEGKLIKANWLER